MSGIQYLTFLGALALTPMGFVCSDIKFFKQNEGESVVLPCAIEQRGPSPIGFYLRRSWLKETQVLFMFTRSDFSPTNDADQSRISVRGDPSLYHVNVTLSELTVEDTDQYYCEFVVPQSSSEDKKIKGATAFFLLVRSADVPGSVHPEPVEACAGGSVVLPCLPPNEEGLAVEGVILKRQRGQAPVEVVYHSKQQHPSISHPSSSSRFPAERVQLSSAPGPSGITYNLTLLQMQSQDSGLYSCQLLLRDRPNSSTTLGRRVFFVSLQGDQCGCSNYSILLYALSSAVVSLLIFLIIGFVVLCKGKANRSVRSHPPAPIYEEMTGVQPLVRKLPPCSLEEMESSEYRNCSVMKSCSENQYESPRGAHVVKS
ncbi:cd7 antigen-like [Pholidichthys leucotaenia]